MKKAIVKGWLYVIGRGTSRERHIHVAEILQSNPAFEFVMPLNFEVEVPEPDAITPVTILADESEFLAMRLKLHTAQKLKIERDLGVSS